MLGDPNTINDPMFSWAVRTNFLYFGDVPEWVPLLVHTPNLTVAQLIKKLPPNPGDGPPAFSLPDLFAAPLPGLEDSHHFCLHLNWSPAPRLQALSLLTWLEKEFGARYEFCLPTEVQKDAPRRLGAEPPKAPMSPAGAARQGPQTFPRSASAPLSASHAEVAIGVIDDGIAFANQRFRTAAVAQTRIDSVWIQHRHTGGGVGFGSRYRFGDAESHRRRDRRRVGGVSCPRSRKLQPQQSQDHQPAAGAWHARDGYRCRLRSGRSAPGPPDHRRATTRPRRSRYERCVAHVLGLLGHCLYSFANVGCFRP